jgi:hypothetical protein
LLEQLPPDVLYVGQDNGDELAHLLLMRAERFADFGRRGLPFDLGVDSRIALAIICHFMETSPGRQVFKILVTSRIPRWFLKRIVPGRLNRFTD